MDTCPALFSILFFVIAWVLPTLVFVFILTQLFKPDVVARKTAPPYLSFFMLFILLQFGGVHGAADICGVAYVDFGCSVVANPTPTSETAARHPPELTNTDTDSAALFSVIFFVIAWVLPTLGFIFILTRLYKPDVIARKSAPPYITFTLLGVFMIVFWESLPLKIYGALLILIWLWCGGEPDTDDGPNRFRYRYRPNSLALILAGPDGELSRGH